MASSQKQADASQQPPQQTQKKPSVMEEDDEFEDFPNEDWAKDETDQSGGEQKNLWEESWDDDDANEDFSKQLKEEVQKVNTAK
ncbi:26 proteasome complex subunit Sem1 [Elaphomyces granulatus]|jgi:26 proteasome complex subunit DSS1